MKIIKIVGLLVLLVIAAIFPFISPNAAITSIAIFTLLFACAATGWNIFGGYTGYLSLGYGTYYGFGAYALAIMCKNWNISGGYTPFLLIPVTGLIAALVAIPIGWISLRTRRETFIVITIATLFIFQLLAFSFKSITNGASGILLPIPPWTGDSFNTPFYYVALGMVLLALVVSWWIRYSKYGLGLLAIRDDEDRALSLGIKTGAYKLSAFSISAFFAGMVGAMYVYINGLVGPAGAFNPVINSFPALMAFLGGVGTLSGPIIGALLLEPLQQYLGLQLSSMNINIDGLDLIINGALLLILLLALPEGIVPALSKLWSRYVRVSKTSPTETETAERDEPLLAESHGGGKAQA